MEVHTWWSALECLLEWVLRLEQVPLPLLLPVLLFWVPPVPAWVEWVLVDLEVLGGWVSAWVVPPACYLPGFLAAGWVPWVGGWVPLGGWVGGLHSVLHFVEWVPVSTCFCT